MNKFYLNVVSMKGSVFSGDVESVSLPASEGQMTVLARHMPIIAPLDIGEVIIKTSESIINLSIGKGIFEFSRGRARLLIEDEEMADDISEQKALEAKRVAEELLAKGVKGEEKIKAVYQLRKSLVDIKIARRIKRKIY